MTLVLALHAAATLFMTGLIWFVQVVHYPLMARVGVEGYPAYQRSHALLTSWVVIPPMLTELALAAALLVFRPPSVAGSYLVGAFALLVVVWLSTFFLQVPQHTRLACGFDTRAHAILVRSNWVRTAGWSLRSVLALHFLVEALSAAPT